MSRKRMIGDTGPKVSYFTTGMSGVTRSITVGAYSAPSRTLPASSRAPRAIASFTCCSQNFAAASSITVPMSTDGSAGLPYDHARVFSTTSAVKRSATASCTSIRLIAVQRCPEFLYEPDTASVLASSRSASSITMIGSLPPSSSTARR
ncbi:hypothetical protein LMG30113_07561 [Burkholderia paludis]|nr:hypothetical protein LMG30113_07561 [Burkholderia paludis]